LISLSAGNNNFALNVYKNELKIRKIIFWAIKILEYIPKGSLVLILA
jgi:hypothetical protein